MKKNDPFPKFNDKFLSNIVEALRRKSKSIKFKTKSNSAQKVVEKERNNKDVEKLETEFSLYNKSQVRLYAWEDRWIWIDVRKPSKNGWVFEWQYEGRLGPEKEQILANAIRSTLDIGSYENQKEIRLIWANLLHKGPIGK